MSCSAGARTAFFLGVFALASCADFERGAPAPAAPTTDGGVAPADGGDAGALSFARQVLPVLASACASCHAAGKEAEDSALLFTGDAAADFAAVSPLVDTAAPGASRLLSKAAGMGHQGGVIFGRDSAEYETILRWIQQGALP